MRSMTGFGRANSADDDLMVAVNIRSVNNKSLSFHIKSSVPSGAWEPKVRALLKKELKRGRVEVQIEVRSANKTKLEHSGLDQWVKTLREFQKKHDLSGELSVHDVLITWSVAATENEPTITWIRLKPVIESAISELIHFRKREGAQLKSWFIEQIAQLQKVIQKIHARRPVAAKERKDHLRERIKEAGQILDPQLNARLETELVLLAEKADIEEEIFRATTHIQAISVLIRDQAFTAKGKRLDFLLQELIRETNTMASKSTDAQIRSEIVNAKTLVDQLREQAANIE